MLISRRDRGAAAKWWYTVDLPLVSAALLLMAIGILVSMAASPRVAVRINLDSFHFIRSQLFYLSIAVVVMFALSFFSQQWIKRIGIFGFLGALVLMIGALFFGPEIKGAHRWINLGPISLQPSEIAKPTFIIAASWFLADKLRHKDMPGNYIAYGMFVCFMMLLLLQPDFGQTALVIATFGSMLLIAGISWSIVLGLAALGVAGIGLSYAFVPHVTSRIDRFISPDKGDTFQTDTATQAFRNGGFLGTGPGGGEAKLVLPDAHTDFTFSVVAEEFGIIACVALMALFLFIVLRVLRRAKLEVEPFPALALSGLAFMFGLQATINMGVNVGLLPAKGMTLPFISYGGSSLIGTAMIIGFMLALARKLPHTVQSRETQFQEVMA